MKDVWIFVVLVSSAVQLRRKGVTYTGYKERSSNPGNGI